MMRTRLSIAALATLFFLAGPAGATVYQFQIVSSASPVSAVLSTTAPPSTFIKFDDVVHSYGEPNPSNTAQAVGTFSADITPGVSIAFLPGANITFASAFNYLPSTTPAQFGFEMSRGTTGLGGPFSNGGQGYASASGYALHFGDASCVPNGGGALASVGGTSYAGSNNTLCGTGGIIQFSGIITGQAGGVGLPFGFGSPNTVTFDGTTIIIPVNSTRDVGIFSGASRIVSSGSIVAQVVAVPEPSSLLLVGLGAFGLAGRGARRRR